MKVLDIFLQVDETLRVKILYEAAHHGKVVMDRKTDFYYLGVLEELPKMHRHADDVDSEKETMVLGRKLHERDIVGAPTVKRRPCLRIEPHHPRAGKLAESHTGHLRGINHSDAPRESDDRHFGHRFLAYGDCLGLCVHNRTRNLEFLRCKFTKKK